MGEFIKEALPFFLIGLSLAIFAAGYYKKHRGKTEKDEWDFSAMGPLFGVAIGIAVGNVNDSIGTALGAGIGMFIGTTAEFFAENIKK